MAESNLTPNNLKIIREELGLTQEQLGKRLGVSGRTIRAYESKNVDTHINLPLEQAISISKEYGYSLDYIYCLKSRENVYQNKCMCDIRDFFSSDEKSIVFEMPLKYWELFGAINNIMNSGKNAENIKEDIIKLLADYMDFEISDVVFRITMPKEDFSAYIQSKEGLIPYSRDHETNKAKHRPTEEDTKQIIDFLESLNKSK